MPELATSFLSQSPSPQIQIPGPLPDRQYRGPIIGKEVCEPLLYLNPEQPRELLGGAEP